MTYPGKIKRDAFPVIIIIAAVSPSKYTLIILFQILLSTEIFITCSYPVDLKQKTYQKILLG
jgi:hypothetical protein